MTSLDHPVHQYRIAGKRACVERGDEYRYGDRFVCGNSVDQYHAGQTRANDQSGDPCDHSLSTLLLRAPAAVIIGDNTGLNGGA